MTDHSTAPADISEADVGRAHTGHLIRDEGRSAAPAGGDDEDLTLAICFDRVVAERDRLRAELAEARAVGRNEGLEEAARIADRCGWTSYPSQVAAAIRAARTDGGPDS